MGTHPIFESDFDCLTGFRMKVSEAQNTIKRCKQMLAETNRQLKQIEQSERLQRQTNKQQKKQSGNQRNRGNPGRNQNQKKTQGGRIQKKFKTAKQNIGRV